VNNISNLNNSICGIMDRNSPGNFFSPICVVNLSSVNGIK
jgi:hypothetical protein